MTKPSSFNREELLQCGHGEMFGEGNARLPVGNMLMMDRITMITGEGGKYGKGYIEADRKTRLNSSHRCSSYAVFCLKKKKTPTASST